VTVSYDSDSADEVEPEDGRRSKSGRTGRHRSSRRSSVASYRSVGNGPRRSDPSLRCVSVSSATERFVDDHFHCMP